ncbi:MAG: sensor histidine kinase, partial [Phenylobacterium sp.]|nr:sensor histidine kinase [Phenylobacterium sp.]
MSLLGRGRPTASLFVQLLTFTVLTLLAAHAISLLVMFKLPPPMPDFYRLSEIEQALHGEGRSFTERVPLEVRTRDTRPGPELDSRTAPLVRAKLAHDLRVSPDTIVIAGNPGPLADRRIFRILRNRTLREGLGEEQFLIAPFQIGVRQPDGRWRVVEPQPSFGLTPWEQTVVLWFVLSGLAMTPIAYIFARRLSAPTRILADAAIRLGRDPQAPPLAVKGSAEIAVAVAAFNEMQARLRRYVDDRTAMVGAVAHDLR